jgi:shikimate kinase
VTPQRHIRNLALIGFMGAGKSSVGRAVAAQLGFEFVDTDALIESRTGKAITQIFATEGEAHFRELERSVVEQLETREGLVISTGGGLPTCQANLDSLKKHSLVVCLWASAERIWERVKSQSHRPLLQTSNPQERIQELLKERAPFYSQADVLLHTDNRSQRQVCQQVIQQFQLAQTQSK